MNHIAAAENFLILLGCVFLVLIVLACIGGAIGAFFDWRHDVQYRQRQEVIKKHADAFARDLYAGACLFSEDAPTVRLLTDMADAIKNHETLVLFPEMLRNRWRENRLRLVR